MRLTKQREEDSSSEEREHTFQCQKTYEVHERAGLAPRGTHEAKSTWHSLGDRAANGSALEMPQCQEVSTIVPNTHIPHKMFQDLGENFIM